MTVRVFVVTVVWLLHLAMSDFFMDDSILYKVDFPGLEDSSNIGGEIQEDMETYTLVSKNKEKYQCFIPRVQGEEEKKESRYHGESPVQLIEKLFKEQQCVHRLESYWTYELCHGKHLRQYHEERAGKELKLQEYFLGRFNADKLVQLAKEDAADKENDITRHPPTKKVQTMNMPYYEITMDDGTVCDLNSEPRKTKILYMCYPTGRNEILSVKETSTCEYEVIVLTSVLCTHPHFKPDEVTEHGIKCRPLNDSPAKPVDLAELEAESSQLRSGRYWEAHFKTGSKPGQVKIEIRPSESLEGEERESEEREDNDNIFHITKPKSERWRDSNREPFKPLNDAEIVKQFLKGEHCLVGGSGWWKYEFCYGKKVDQFHVNEQTGAKTLINLGTFNKMKHLKWISEHQSKKPKPLDKRKFVSHFYSDGDICDITGTPRHVEVKLKCKEAESASFVSLYLLEPKTCQYVLGIESPLVCDILPQADSETGLMPPGLIDNLELSLENTSESPPVINSASFLSEIEEAVKKIRDFKGRPNWVDRRGGGVAEADLRDLEEEGVFSKEEVDRLTLLRDRLRRRKKAGEEEDIDGVDIKNKKFLYSSSTRQETPDGTIKEHTFIVDGERIKLQEVVVDDKIISTRVIREREMAGGKRPTAEDTSSQNENSQPDGGRKEEGGEKQEAGGKDEL